MNGLGWRMFGFKPEYSASLGKTRIPRNVVIPALRAAGCAFLIHEGSPLMYGCGGMSISIYECHQEDGLAVIDWL
jgi:hypothetical protein